MNAPQWIKCFVNSAGAILLLAGLERLLIADGDAAALSLTEPILNVPLRYGVLLVGLIELAVGLFCLWDKRIHLQTGWLACVIINYAVYRIGVLLGGDPQGSCIGTLTDPLHLGCGMTGTVISFIPVYLLLGSCAAFFWLWISGRNARSVKMSCPGCGIHIQFDSERVGQWIDCPKCQKSIVLRGIETLKMSCFFCRGHIEFPSHAEGRRRPCPHCGMDIMLKEQKELPIKIN